MFRFSQASLAQALVTAALVATPAQSPLAAPGTLPSAPLFLSTIVEPNVFFTIDDSGSMDYELVVEDTSANTGNAVINGLPGDDGVPPNQERIGYLHPDWAQLYTNRTILPPSHTGHASADAAWDKYWVFRNHNGNKLYYNPNTVYTPWPGSNADGTPMYTDANPTKVWKDPNLTGATDLWVDLTQPVTTGDYAPVPVYLPTYYEWNDSDGDGVIEFTDGYKRVQIAAGTPEMQNFANWFQYYRSRINTAKAAIGAVINTTDASRMGMRLFNLTANLVHLKTMNDVTNKRDFLTAFYNILITQQGTPGRSALASTGRYFQDPAKGAILPIADGGECQQNFNIFMTDGFWNSDNAPTSLVFNKPENRFDAVAIGNEDIDGGGNNTIFDGNAGQSNDGGNYADAYSATLADVAMLFYETDLRSNYADSVPTQAGVDEATHQHLVNFTIAFGITGKLDPGTVNPLSLGFAWPEPIKNTFTTVDDTWHAAYNSRGDFLPAQTPAQLESSLNNAISDIAQRTGTAAAVAINSAQLSTESVVYLAQFNSNRWQGNLLAFPIIDTDTGELAATPKWSAAAELNGRDFSAKPRTVITYNDLPAVADGVPFQWSSIPLSMQLDLKTNPIGGLDADAVGQARLEYLRGDRTNEGTGYFFRERLSMLADIVNSGPVFVGEPALSWPDFAPFPTGTAAYSEFKNGPAASRDKMVYVGSNDGMLHGFSDDTGEEVFAYIPSIFTSSNVGEGLHYLTDQNYVHNFYVDLTPAISDVYISSGSSTEWHTVLVGALRGGGRGLFALNVTDPNLFQEANADKLVLWEFSGTDDADLGFTYSRPFIALTNSGKWVAIFGNGYNDLGSGEAKLFVVDLEGGVDGVWTAGTDYIEITTGAGDTTNRNGLATPALADVDGNGTVDRVYAGDLQGNLWVFDMSSSNASQWDVAFKSGSTPLPLFTTPAGQPLTAKPVLAKHPTQPDSGSPSNAPNVMVYFGTGQYLVDADKTSTGVQSFYGVWDKGDASRNRTHLIEQTFDTNFTVPVLTRNPLDYSVDYGWYFDLPTTRERAVTSPIARGDTVFFNSFVPVDDPCSVGGFGFKYAVDMNTGGSPLEPTFDANGDGIIDENDYVSDGTNDSTLVAVQQEGFLPEPVFIEDLAFTAETATKVKALKDVPVGRFSWQELIQ